SFSLKPPQETIKSRQIVLMHGEAHDIVPSAGIEPVPLEKPFAVQPSTLHHSYGLCVCRKRIAVHLVERNMLKGVTDDHDARLGTVAKLPVFLANEHVEEHPAV